MAKYTLTKTGAAFLERLKKVTSSKYFPKGVYKESTKHSIESLENNCANPYGALIQILSVLIQFSDLDVDSKMVLAAKSLDEIQKRARVYEEIRELRATLPSALRSNKSNTIYELHE